MKVKLLTAIANVIEPFTAFNSSFQDLERNISDNTKGRRREFLRRVLMCGVAAIHEPSVFAADYPTKPIRVIVPFAAGGGSDVVTRVVWQKVSESLGQPVIVENRVGAGGNIGTAFVASALPDGYTVVMGGVGPFTINQFLFGSMSYDPMRDFIPITQAVSVTNMLVVHPSVPVSTVGQLIEYAKKNPGKLAIATGGAGTPGHMAAGLFNSMTGANIPLVPYKGAAPAVNDLIGGQVNVSFEGLLSTLQYVKAGRLKALGVTTATRSSQLPEVPTIAEAGLPGYAVNNWYGYLVPAGTPRSIVERLHREIAKALQSPEVKEKLVSGGAEAVGNSPAEFAEIIQTDLRKWRKVVMDTGMKAE
jgi:tripartite-type tricarboxylate transporter receptor subunit TctC